MVDRCFSFESQPAPTALYAKRKNAPEFDPGRFKKLQAFDHSAELRPRVKSGIFIVDLRSFTLSGPGGDRLSHVLRRSTIGAGAFHFRVRDGIGCLGPRNGHQAGVTQIVFVIGLVFLPVWEGWALINESDQADRAISTGKLHALPHFHTRPIDVVVFHGSDRENLSQGGLPA